VRELGLVEAAGSSGSLNRGDAVLAAARAFERDRYLAALLAPGDAQQDLLALAAFAGEIGRIPGAVSEPMMGEIRLQWWRDALSGSGSTGQWTGHPVADAVRAAMIRRRIDASELHAIIDAQAERLADRPFETLAGLEAHLRALDGGLFTLAWRILGGERTAPELLREAGCVYGLSRCLVEAPAELAQGRIILPTALLARHGLDETLLTRPAQSKAWLALQVEMAALTRDRLERMAVAFRMADPMVRCAALPLAVVRPYLKLSQRRAIGGLDVRDVAALSRVWRIWLASRTGHI
jgi:phytoene synthase